MERQDILALVPSLQKICLRKFTSELIAQKDFINSAVVEFDPEDRMTAYCNGKEVWDSNISNHAKEKVSSFILPALFKEELIKTIDEMVPEMEKWRLYHGRFLKNLSFGGYCLLNKLRWTCIATIDYKKTAELLVKDEEIFLSYRYKLACLYCLCDDIATLWNMLSPQSQRYIYRNVDFISEDIITIVWSYILQGEETRLFRKIEREFPAAVSVNHYAFEYAARNGYKIAAQHFFQRLTAAEKRLYLVEAAQLTAKARSDTDRRSCYPCFIRETYSELFVYLLSQMNEAEKIEVFRTSAYEVLKCFLDWPWKDVFLEVAKDVWDFLPKKHFYSLLLHLFTSNCLATNRHREIFRAFWRQSPDVYKKFAIENMFTDCRLLTFLCGLKDEESTRLVFESASRQDKERVINSYIGLSVSYMFAKNKRWDCFHLLIDMCDITNIVAETAKVGYFIYSKFYYYDSQLGFLSTPDEDPVMKTIFHILDAIVERNKRKHLKQE
ncbi:uncharacterized protein CDAR_166071 [Caerostris darwini]|uniref:Uncharacterized protein n=1 Tax=Caerostris darwini TaxID=1538125 RepID=A0AAV4RYN9_9ARAC|nr:uncharacterized protein CDAR_166071 [Caerostris darwini]